MVHCRRGNITSDVEIELVFSSFSLLNDGKDMRAAPVEFAPGYRSSAAVAGVIRPSNSIPAADRKVERPPHILLATTGQLPSTARLAIELKDAGADVSLVSPRNHPAIVLNIFSHRLAYRAAAPIGSLEAAMMRARPDVVIPADERTVRDLHQLWRETRHSGLRLAIEGSLGPCESFPVVTSRSALLAAAGAAGVRIPASAPLPSAAALDEWMAHNPCPFVLKADGSWSGFGVRIITDANQAMAAYADMTRRASGRLALREAALEGNNFGIRSWLRRERPAMSAQAFIDGWPANIGVACWQGEVLAAISMESVATLSATGPSTAARIIDSPDMLASARKVVKALHLSGMIGLDFMIEAATGLAYLIELNPRNTPICAIPMGPGRDLPEAFVARLASRSARERPARTDKDVVAFFPDTWQVDPSSHFLHTAYHDVPWDQPDLVRMLLRPELRDRYQFTRMLRKAWWALQGKKPPAL